MKFKKIIFIFILSIMLIFSLGIIVNFICLINIGIPVASNNDWIGFWGSIIGSLLGSLVTVIIFKETITHEYNKQKKEIIPFLRYTLLKYNIDNIKTLGSINMYYPKIFDNSGLYSEEIDKNFIIETKKESKSRVPDINFKLNIENIGLGAALDLKIINVKGNLEYTTLNDSSFSLTHSEVLNAVSIKVDESINLEFKAYLTLNGDINPFKGERTFFNSLKESTYKDNYIFDNAHSNNNNHLSGQEFIVITFQYKTLRSEFYTQSIEIQFKWNIIFDSQSGNTELKYDADIKNITDPIIYK